MFTRTAVIVVLAWWVGLHTTARAQSAEDSATAIHPFRIQVDDAVLDDLQQRLARTRFTDEIPGTGWTYGTDRAYLQSLVEHWRTSYDWRKWEARLNEFDQFTTEIDGLNIHFLHVRSTHENALPLIVVHGWPGSFVEFYKIIGPLTDPEAYGGKADDAFHVVCPSLPGFGFSERPSEPGWSSSRMAGVMATLMERLGYQRYGAQGGDWGAGVARWLGNYDSQHVAGVHLNFLPGSVAPNGAGAGEGVSAEELARWEQRRVELEPHKAYGAIQGTRPQTLGAALNDSPAGLAAWIVDKFWAWSDHGGDLDNSFTKDELITNVMIYWVSETAPSAARIYFERGSYTGGRPSGKVPVGCALFPKEINVPPRAWVEAQLNVVHWTEMPRGGHFAALEQPDLLLDDVRSFFRQVR